MHLSFFLSFSCLSLSFSLFLSLFVCLSMVLLMVHEGSVKFNLEQAMKSLRWNRGIAVLFL